MEKKKPHYQLKEICKLIRSDAVIITDSARVSIVGDFDISVCEALEAVLSLDYTCFYKSMTVNASSQIWQDVYHQPINGTMAYIKLQINVRNKAVVISFKKKG
jgi:hypothetical protein